jgi:anti-sigma regulatory factor (Ser/Thr protein kinase)
MTRLHFQPIQGRSLDILDAIIKNEEVASADDVWRKLSVVVEELVLNIVDYANSDYLDVEIIRDEKSITLRFHDGGIPFNPLEKEEPDFTIPLEDRKIGGLGIFMVTKYMDTVTYERTGEENILTVRKNVKKQKGK